MKKRNGFTLIEFLVVLALLMILLGLIIPPIQAVRNRVKYSSVCQFMVNCPEKIIEIRYSASGLELTIKVAEDSSKSFPNFSNMNFVNLRGVLEKGFLGAWAFELDKDLVSISEQQLIFIYSDWIGTRILEEPEE